MFPRSNRPRSWELDKLLEMTIHAMAASEDEIRAEMTAEGLD